MNFLTAITFSLLLFQVEPLLQTIKADSNYKVYVDSQIKIRDGMRTKHFVFPSNFLQLSQTQLKSVDMQVWTKVLQEEGMVNSEEFVKLHFLQWNSMLKVVTKFRTEIEKLNPEEKTMLLLAINIF